MSSFNNGLEHGLAMPTISPQYPPPPVEYKEASLVVGISSGDYSAQVIPDGFQPIPGGFWVVLFADYPQSTIGPYKEMVVLISVTFRDVVGLYCPLIYVTSDVALCQGREVWGFPKKLAQIEVTSTTTGEVLCSLERHGKPLCKISGIVDQPGDPSLASAIGSMPIFNRKYIPGPSRENVDLDYVTSAYMSASPDLIYSGAGELVTYGEVAHVLEGSLKLQLVKMSANCILSEGQKVLLDNQRP